MAFCKRYHLLEVNDQPWWPPILREKVQDALTLAWTNKFPVLQAASPAAHVAQLLPKILGSRITDYVYVDFASGAGGPTPYIEQDLNAQLSRDGQPKVKFVLTDISPHVTAWKAAAKNSQNLSYIAESVDATNAPSAKDLLRNVSGTHGKKIMRLFSLAFHHFDDDMAAKVLQNTIETADGFCIFELQSRNISSVITVSLLWVMLMLMSPFHYLHDPVYLFFTYLLPWVPFIVVFDGYISMLRTRTPAEVQLLLRSKVPENELKKWKFISGETQHTWPIGWLSWIICYKED